MFATNLEEIALKVNGIYNKIEDLSDISPTILNLTGEYTSLVDDDDLQVSPLQRVYGEMPQTPY